MPTFRIRVALAALAVGMACGHALAEDLVRLRFVPAHPSPDRSSEAIQLSLSRISAATPGDPQDVDRYFDGVRKSLDEAGAPATWTYVIPDSAWIEIDITLGARRHTLSGTFDADGIPLPASANATDRRMAAAFREILALSVDRVSRRAPPRRGQ